MIPPVFIIDTNVIVSALITTNIASPASRIISAMLDGKLLYLLSPQLLGEYRTVLNRPKLSRQHQLNGQEIDRLLTELTANAIWREPTQSTGAPDPGDDHLWDLMAAHPGSILVTGDRLLLESPPDHSSVISPKTCLDSFMQNPGRLS